MRARAREPGRLAGAELAAELRSRPRPAAGHLAPTPARYCPALARYCPAGYCHQPAVLPWPSVRPVLPRPGAVLPGFLLRIGPAPVLSRQTAPCPPRLNLTLTSETRPVLPRRRPVLPCEKRC